MARQKKSSQIDFAVHEDDKRNAELDAQPGMNPSGGTPLCGNAEAMEDMLVIATANWFAEKLKKPIQDVVYAPNRRTELKCGFDLSVAPANSKELRLRIQNKASTTWCDLANTIVFKAKDRPDGRETQTEEERFRHQVRLLCSLHEQTKGVSYPYLLVQQCFCLHDYRRMDREVLDVAVPPIDSNLRSIAVDLADKTFVKACWKYDTWELRIVTDPAANKATCQAIMPKGDPITLNVRNLGYLVSQLG